MTFVIKKAFKKNTSSMSSEIWYFEDVNLYQVLCPHKTAKLSQKHRFYHFKKDDFIYFEDDPADKIFLVADGRVKIGTYSEEGEEFVKAILGRGEIFGELSLLGEERRGDFAQALDSDTSVCPMTLADMEELMRENRTLSFKIHKIIKLRVKKLERRLASMLFKNVRTRLREFLEDMAQEKGEKKPNGEIFVENHLTHKDIAQLIGSSRQSVTSLLNELEEEQVIRFEKKNFYLKP